MKKSIVAILLLFAVPALAVTYTWTDDRGTVNFTEDMGNIPPKYRKKAKVVGAEDETVPASTKEIREESKPATNTKDTESAKEQPAGNKELKKTYGGKTTEVWRKEFGQLNAEIMAAEDQLADLRGSLSDTSKMSRSDYLSIQRTIKNVEDRISGLRKRRDALNEDANKAEVPTELRGQ
jgi:hypothetical protein